MIDLIVLAYWLTITGLSFFGLLGLCTLWLYWLHRHDTRPLPQIPPTSLPPVTVQLPVFNERYVVDRLIEAAVNLDYPQDRLQIQVVDDSTDDTTAKATRLVQYYAERGIDIQLLHRDNRCGYKAGALGNALRFAKGEYIAIFDADFQPEPDFLYRTVPYFLQDDDLGMVQVRWGHLNQDYSPLTAAQAIAIDKHFTMDQLVRHRARIYPKFNGAGGIWRRDCLEDAGGWQDDTVCEDLCLSTRAVLKGWQFHYLNHPATPAELPTSISAYKSQQSRWAKGSMQCLLKYGKAILTDRQRPLFARLYALLTMMGYCAHFFACNMLLLLALLVYVDYQFPRWMLLFSVVAVGQPALFVLGQQVLYTDWRRRMRYFPALLIITLGMGPSLIRATLQAIFGRHRAHPFIRTPKGTADRLPDPSLNGSQQTYWFTFDRIVLVEIGLALYALLGISMALWRGNYSPLFFLTTCFLGYSYVAYLSYKEFHLNS